MTEALESPPTNVRQLWETRKETWKEFVRLNFERDTMSEKAKEERLEARKKWDAACATVDRTYDTGSLYQKIDALDQKFTQLNNLMLAAPIRTFADVIVILEFWEWGRDIEEVDTDKLDWDDTIIRTLKQHLEKAAA